MNPTAVPTLHRMQALTGQWAAARDDRGVFLRCYALMTDSMLTGIAQREFIDGIWVQSFVDRFAGYYFAALDAYDRDTPIAPPVWRIAFDSARDPGTWALQKLLLGVNAHINYDLVLTLDELLSPAWADLSPAQRADRRADYDTVNAIIRRTIDNVQDEVLEPAMPVMDWIDRLMGPADERLLSRLLTGWRDQVWLDASRLMEAGDEAERAAVTRAVEAAALRRAQAIALTDWTALTAFM